MSRATMTSKGQITLPVEVRRALGLDSGDGVTFEPAGDGAFLIRPDAGDIRKLKGIVAPPARPVSLADMEAAIRRRASGR
ncbi:MAG: AbrB/MazE/SpoVT family DNA-binding domain-containing protein [Methylocystis sp.]|uniref:AbrB/MazE/SpoVT family DNA-binding domain-containing protein n=1 Tax=Methylocystis sp. TaxID=1911079 RepID=UPI003DA63B23